VRATAIGFASVLTFFSEYYKIGLAIPMLAGTVVGATGIIISLLISPETRGKAGALAKRHVGYGAKAEHYPVVGAALLWTLEKGLGDGLDAGSGGCVGHRLWHARPARRKQPRSRYSWW
jgi:hypothetical protein